MTALWVYAATRLWATRVPGDLHLPHVAPRSLLSAHDLDEARSFDRFIRFEFVASKIALIAALVWYARNGLRFARESAAGRIGTGMLLAMLGLAIVWIVQFPFRLAGHWWARKHGIAEQGYLEWLLGDWFSLGGRFVFVCAGIVIVMGLAGPLKRFWWVAAVPVVAGLALLFALASPYLTPNLERLSNPALAADARELARQESVPGTPVSVMKVRDFTSAPNAGALGFGPSRRVVLFDTLVDSFPRREVKVVVAHELGHITRGHAWKRIAFLALLVLPGAAIVEAVTRQRGGLRAPRAIPLALLVVAVLQLAALPLDNAFSRRLEAEADWVALQTTRDPVAARSLFARFGREAHDDPAPPGWAVALLGDHPSLTRRVAMAEAWQERQASAR
ncbi:MAG TPA: M48 family metalloprotease [Thermoleophilaceae bacterium]